MALSQALGKTYEKVENGFYSIIDSLGAKGIPADKLVNAIDSKGIPAFPVAIAVVALIIVLLYGLIFVGTSYDVSISLSISDDSGETLQGVSLSASYDNGDKIVLPKSTYSSGDEIELQGIPINARIVFNASKEGYLADQYTVAVIDKSLSADLLLERELTGIIGKLRLVDIETGTTIQDAIVIATLANGESRNCYSRDGVFECSSIVDGELVELTITADNYEDFDNFVVMTENAVYELDLVPKPTASFGEANFVIRVIDEGNEIQLQEVRIQVYDAETNELITDVIDDDGEFLDSIQKGTVVRFVVSKDGYVRYDSSIDGEEITIRDDYSITVRLLSGGAAITINVVESETGLVVPGATVMLFNELSDLLDSKLTQFGGFVGFEDLNAEATYYVTAYSERYLPERIIVTPLDEFDYTLELETARSNNSSKITVAVTNRMNEPVNDAIVEFYEIIEEGSAEFSAEESSPVFFEGEETIVITEVLPLGIPNQKTNLLGTVEIYAELGKTVLVKVSKGALGGEGELLVEAGQENTLAVYMSKLPGVVELLLKNENGEVISSGYAVIETASGKVLYDGEVPADGKLYIFGEGITTADLKYTNTVGDEFTDEIYLPSGQSEVGVTIVEGGSDSLRPEVEFSGIYNLLGQEVQGVTKDEEYYLRFKLRWPYGNPAGGLHIRVGDDAIKYSDGDDVGIVGFNGVSDGFRYGRTYSAMPLPGFESIDMQNTGSSGNYNKWLELYFLEGSDTKLVNVRVKAKENTTADSFMLSYRAWTEIAGSLYRAPEDDLLLLDEFSAEKSALYAETEQIQLRIFDTQTKCENEVCASFKFIRQDGSSYLPENFDAAQNELYALEVDISPLKDTTAKIKASTSKTNPKIAFTGFGIDQFAEFPDTESQDTSIEVKDVVIDAGESTKIRLYFKTKELENTYVTAQIITDESVITKTFNFIIYFEKELRVSTIPETVFLGEDFSIVVKDEDEFPIEDALIKIKNYKKELLETIVGDSAPGNGQSGVYRLQNTFDAGTLYIEISSKGAKPYNGTIEIGKQGIIALPRNAIVYIPKGETDASSTVDLENTAEETVLDVEYELQLKPGFPADMELEISVPAAVRGNSRESVVLTGKYDGEKERVHGAAHLIIRGKIMGKYSVSAEMDISIEYNKQLEQECLEFGKEQLSIFVLSDGGSIQSETIPVTNKCALALKLVPEAVALGAKDDNIKIEIPEITLQATGNNEDTMEVRVDVINDLERQYPEKRTFKYDLVFSSDAITKSIPLEVVIWDRRYALQMSRNIEVWLAETEQSELPGAYPGYGAANGSAPLFIKNIGETDIENLEIRPTAANKAEHVQIQILPTISVAKLEKGKTLIPTKWVYVQGLRTANTTPVEVTELSITGMINGRQYEFGPAYVTTHVSGYQCLEVAGNEAAIDFTSTSLGGRVMKRSIRVVNKCAEALRIRTIHPTNVRNNTLGIIPAKEFLLPGEATDVAIVLRKNTSYQLPVSPAYLRAFLVNSGKWITSQHFTLNINIGRASTEGERAVSTLRSIQVCDSPDKRNVRFPTVSSSSSCESSYCDAENLAKYIAERISDQIKDAETQVLRYGQDASNAGCYGTESCSFTALGVKTTVFNVYMMNDQVSEDLMLDVMDNDNELSKYAVGLISSPELFAGTFGAIPHKIWFTEMPRGCGMYSVQIEGGVKVSGTKLMPDFMNILVNVNPEIDSDETDESGETRERTAQCDNKIQNVMNFLPTDKSYSESNPMYTWLSVVETTDAKLNDLGKELAAELFGNEERHSSSGTASRLVVEYGDVEGGLVKVCTDRSEGLSPKEITATIVNLGGDDAQKKELWAEVGKILSGLKRHSINGCITDDESCLILKSAAALGDLVIEPCDKLAVQYERDSCCDFNVVSKIKQSINVDIELESEQQGTSEPWIEDEGEAIGAGAEIEMFKDSRKNKLGYVANLELCVRGESDLHLVPGKNVLINSQATDGGVAAEEQRVPLQICAIHPYDLVSDLSNPEKTPAGEYWVTVAWKGDPEEEYLFSNLERAGAKQQHCNNAHKIQMGQDTEEYLPTLTWGPEQSAKMWGMGACSAVAIGLGMFKGIWTGVLDAALLCAIPYGWDTIDHAPGTFGEVLRSGKQFLQSAWNFVKEVPGLKQLGSGIGWIGEKITDALTLDSSAGTGFEEVADITAGTGSVYAMKYGLAAELWTQPIGTTSAWAAGDAVANEFASEFVRQNFQGLAAAERNNIQNAIRTHMSENISRELRNLRGSGLRAPTVASKLQEATKLAYDSLAQSDDFVNAVFANRANVATGAARTAMDEALDAAIKTAANPDDVGKVVADGLADISASGKNLSGAMRSANNSFRKLIELELESRLAGSFTLVDPATSADTPLWTEIKAQLKSKARLAGAPIDSGSDDAVRILKSLGFEFTPPINPGDPWILKNTTTASGEISGKIASENVKARAQSVVRSILNNSGVDDLMKNELKTKASRQVVSQFASRGAKTVEDVAASQLKKLSSSRLKNIVRPRSLAALGAELFKATLRGGAAILVGELAYEAALKHYSGETTVAGTATPDLGDVPAHLRENQNVRNFESYKITKSPGASITFDHINDLRDVMVEWTRMDMDCSGQVLQRELVDSSVEFTPPEPGSSNAQYVSNYCSEFAKFISATVETQRVTALTEHEMFALLSAIAIWKTNYGEYTPQLRPGQPRDKANPKGVWMMGCDYENSETVSAEQQILCAAKKLRIYSGDPSCSSLTGDAMAECLLNAYNNDAANYPTPGVTINSVMATYREWQESSRKYAT